MRRTATPIAVLAVLALALTLGACQFLKEKVGIHTTISDPERGSAEAVLQDMLRAGLEKSQEKGWTRYKKLLHSDLKHAGSLKHLRENNYPSFRRKAKYYVTDEATVSFEIVRIDERSDDKRTFYLYSTKTPDPTPCTLQKDPKSRDQWKIKRCSL